MKSKNFTFYFFKGFSIGNLQNSYDNYNLKTGAKSPFSIGMKNNNVDHNLMSFFYPNTQISPLLDILSCMKPSGGMRKPSRSRDREELMEALLCPEQL